jgi:peptide/nickel transport system permease protein
MVHFIIRRILIAIPIVIGTTAITFFLMMASIGNYIPGLQISSSSASGGDIEALRQAMGLNEPVYIQYLRWLWHAVQGNFGNSLVDHSPVTSLIFQALPNSLLLGFLGMIVALIIAIPVGVISAWKRGTKLDNILGGLSVAGFAIPQFWLGLILILVFAVLFNSWGLPHLPAGGAYTIGNGSLGDRAVHVLLPTVVVAVLYLSVWSRYTRSSVIETLAEDYIRTARAKGMGERRKLLVHALRNALLPLVTLVGLQLRTLVSGAVVVEVVFNWPGMGLLFYNRALEYDYTTVLGITVIATITVILGNLLADIAYAALDPRVRLQ